MTGKLSNNPVALRLPIALVEQSWNRLRRTAQRGALSRRIPWRWIRLIPRRGSRAMTTNCQSRPNGSRSLPSGRRGSSCFGAVSFECCTGRRTWWYSTLGEHSWLRHCWPLASSRLASSPTFASSETSSKCELPSTRSQPDRASGFRRTGRTTTGDDFLYRPTPSMSCCMRTATLS